MNTIKILLISIPLFSCLAGLPDAKFTVKVIDQNGVNVTNATVNAQPRKVISKALDIEKITDTNATVTFHVSSVLPWVNTYINKENYYQSGLAVGLDNFKKNKPRNRWEPWNETHVITLKEKLNPTPMYAQTIKWVKFPILNKPVGYDLEKGDWVAPYGNGIISDFILNCHNEYPQRGKYLTSFKLTFSNIDDGIQIYNQPISDRSQYIWPYLAPENGYNKELYKVAFSNWKSENSYNAELFTEAKEHKKRNYIFRIRTTTDDNGNIISAMYGKIQGDFFVSGAAGGGGFKFTYYLNPTGTRNLEFDTRNNLFKWNRRQYERFDLLKP